MKLLIEDIIDPEELMVLALRSARSPDYDETIARLRNVYGWKASQCMGIEATRGFLVALNFFETMLRRDIGDIYEDEPVKVNLIETVN